MIGNHQHRAVSSNSPFDFDADAKQAAHGAVIPIRQLASPLGGQFEQQILHWH